MQFGLERFPAGMAIKVPRGTQIVLQQHYVNTTTKPIRTRDVAWMEVVPKESVQIPAGFFGPEEQSFRANFVRQNVLRFDVTQPIYTGGRIQYGLAASQSQATSAQYQLDRARQSLTLELVQAYYGALLQQQGIAVAEEGLRRAGKTVEMEIYPGEGHGWARAHTIKAYIERMERFLQDYVLLR